MRSDTLVVIPAWNEEASLPAVLAELRRELARADVLVVDDGSTDGTARAAREAGTEVLSLAGHRGLPDAIAAGYAYAAEHGYQLCGRVDADGQHPPRELARLLELVSSGSCDVAIGSRFASGDGHAAYRYSASPARRLGHFLLRRLVRLRLGRPVLDATSGMWAVNDRALPILALPYTAEAPEVEALIRAAEAGLRVEEVPVDMRERASGRSKLVGSRSVAVVLTVAAAVLFGRHLRRRRR